MKKPAVYLLLLLTLALPALGQTQATATGAIVDRVDLAGVDMQKLSVELRDALRALVGKPYDAVAANQLADRIQNEVPGNVAAPRTLAGPEAGRVRVVFVVATSSAAPGGPDSNVNSQYVVESVEVKGLDRSKYSNAIYEEMQKMVGQRLDNNVAEDLRVRLSSEVVKEYFVRQKIERGSMPQHVKVVFDVERTPWLFRVTLGRVFNGNIGKGTIEIGTPNREKDNVEAVEVAGVPTSRVSPALSSELQLMVGKRVDRLEIDHLLEKLKAELKEDYKVESQLQAGSKAFQTRLVYKVEHIPWLSYRNPRENVGYHQKQGVTFVCCEDEFIGKHTTLNLNFDGDSLTERTKGLTLGLESVELGSRHFGARLEFETLGSQWKQQTRSAMAATPGLPGLYRSREKLAPSVAFAFNRYVQVSAGANLTELEMEEGSRWRSAHAGVAALRYDSKPIKRGQTNYHFSGGYDVRTGARSIGSSFSYTRHAFDQLSIVRNGKHALKLSLMAGKITGNAPLFERFTLGNMRTLRGFNKYDIAPLGGDRAWHYSAEYNYSVVGVFLDQGAVWGNGLSSKPRQSVGITFGNIIGVGMPVNCKGNECGLTFFVNAH